MRPRKLITSTAHRFRWWPPTDGVVSSDPTLTVSWPAGSQAYTLALARESDTVSAIRADRRTLSVTWGASGSPTVLASPDEPAAAQLVGVGVVDVPVRVVRVVTAASTGLSGTVELSDPLPYPVLTSGISLVLHWHERSAVLNSAHVPAVTTDGVRWSVPYTASLGGISVAYGRDMGVLRVVAMPFATGLTDARLLGLLPDLRARPTGQSSWASQREAALDDLVVRIRSRIAPRIEDVLPGRDYELPHAYLTGALIAEAQGRADAADRLRVLADEDIVRRLALVDWMDLDRDGVVDAGETDTGASGSLASGIGSTLTSTSIIPRYDDGGASDDVPVRVGSAR